MSSGAKGSSGGQNDVYGHCFGILCQGQLDFIWGIEINNVLTWPPATLWDSQIWQAGLTVIYIDGNVYSLPVNFNADPPAAPWELIAEPWAVGTYTTGQEVLHGGILWLANTTTSTAPPTSAPPVFIGLQYTVATGDWTYISTPGTWASIVGTVFWPANSIVAWAGRLYITPSGTNVEPPGAPWVLWKQDRDPAVNPLKLTVAATDNNPSNGEIYIYWGTPDQVLDEVDEAVLFALGHPPYRNRAGIMLKNFLFGPMQVSPPDIKVLGGRKPVQSIITGDATNYDADWQVNPWCVLAEFLTHPVLGLGLPASYIDAESWQDEADFCAANPELYYISPIYTALKTIREITQDILGYPDAFIFWNTVAALQAGHWPHDEAPPAFDGTNTVNRDVIIKGSPIDWDSAGWDGTKNAVSVSFDDIQGDFASRPMPSSNLFNRDVVGRLTTAKVSKNFIVRANQAAAWAAELARMSGDQTLQGDLKCRAERVKGILPGDAFLLTDDVLGVSLPQRCTQRTVAAPPSGIITLKHETERGFSPQPYAPSISPVNQGNQYPPAPITNFLMVQIPQSLGTGPDELMCLAARDSEFATAFEVWFQQADTVAFQRLATHDGFSVAALLGESINTQHGADTTNPVTAGHTLTLTHKDIWNVSVSYTPGGGAATAGVNGTDYLVDPVNGTVALLPGGGITTGSSVTVSYAYYVKLNVSPVTPASDIEAISRTLTDDEINDNEIIAFLFQQSNPQKFEIVSIKEVSAVGGGSYTMQLRRGQYGTQLGGDGSHVWTAGDFAFVAVRADLSVLTHTAFHDLMVNEGTAKFILAPISAFVTADITDIYNPASNPKGLATEIDYTFNNPYAPQLAFTSATKNGATITDFTVAFATTDVFEVTFTLTSLLGTLSWASLTAVLGGQKTTLWTQNFQPSSFQAGDVKFSLPSAGSWQVYLNALDASGNAATIPLATNPINVQGGAATAPTPFYNYGMFPATEGGTPGIIGLYWYKLTYFSIPVVDADVTVYYQIQPTGTAFNPAAWIAAPNIDFFGSPTTQYGYVNFAPYGFADQFFPGRTAITVYAYATKTGAADSAVVAYPL